MDDQFDEYNKIKKYCTEKDIKLVDETKNPFNLRSAIFMYHGLDALSDGREKELRKQGQRYPARGEGLMIDPFAYDAPKDKKKKKGK